MKKFYAAVILFLVSTILIHGMNRGNGEIEKIVVEIDKTKLSGSMDIERSMDSFSIEAYFYPRQGLVEVLLHNIGDASVYLLNSNYQLVWSGNVETSTPSVLYMDTFASRGIFYLEIISPLWYARGTINFK